MGSCCPSNPTHGQSKFTGLRLLAEGSTKTPQSGNLEANPTRVNSMQRVPFLCNFNFAASCSEVSYSMGADGGCNQTSAEEVVTNMPGVSAKKLQHFFSFQWFLFSRLSFRTGSPEEVCTTLCALNISASAIKKAFIIAENHNGQKVQCHGNLYKSVIQ